MLTSLRVILVRKILSNNPYNLIDTTLRARAAITFTLS